MQNEHNDKEGDKCVRIKKHIVGLMCERWGYKEFL